MKTCVICGNDKFGLGPNGRKSFDGVSLPRCTKCQSLERHRALREFWDRFPKEFLKDKQVLQFSPDRSVESGWFKKYEVSTFDGENSLDLQNIDRPDANYDVVICVHVLEHVQHDQVAVQEMLRVINNTGFIVLAIPAPFHREKTVDWGFPKQEEHGHYRVYGKDVRILLLDKVVGEDFYIQVLIEDTATGSQDCVYLLTKDRNATMKLKDLMKGWIIES
jgi:SAM-dependent methyltransferase